MEQILDKAKKGAVTIYFIALGSMMHFFITEAAFIGGIGVSYRHIFAIIIIFSALLYFLITPNLSRGIVTLKECIVMSVPTVIMLVSSLLIWLLELTDIDMIMRGISYYFIYSSNISAALAAGAFLYVFGENGIWYYLISILISNVSMLIRIMLQNGVGTFVSELITLIVTFADETGEVIVQAEIHELAFCLGLFLIYMLLNIRKKPLFLVMLGIAGFCFICAFKRIAVAAIAVSVGVAYLLKLVAKIRNHKSVMRVINVVTWAIIIFLVIYIGAVHAGLFETLEKAGFETNGRDKIYRYVNNYYEFSPTFIGRGMAWLSYQLNEVISIGVTAVHNDFLQFYIDLGFWGYVLWLFSMTMLRTSYFGRNSQTNHAIIAFAVILYMLIVSMTDNTMNYQLFNGTAALLIMGHGFDKRVREDEQKRFEYISQENKEQGWKLL